MAAIAALSVILGIVFFNSSSHNDAPQSEVVVEEVEEVEVEDLEEATQPPASVEPEAPADLDNEPVEEAVEPPTENVVDEDISTEEDTTSVEKPGSSNESGGTSSSDSDDSSSGFIQDVKDIGNIVKNWWDSFWDSSTGKGIKEDIDSTVEKIIDPSDK